MEGNFATDYKPGDKVRVRDYKEIQAQFVDGHRLPSGCYFPSVMKAYCGEETIVLYFAQAGTRYKLKGMEDWVFTDEMLESVDEPIIGNCEISFASLLGV